uniref:Uncharacterized protein n=1 Tax=Anser brachyrhynchus TaxID=132585 RepID=A0A8B9BSQ2_9AVES
MGEKKASGRVPEAAQRRVLDRATRQRRLNRQLEALENDNFGDDPQAGLPRPGLCGITGGGQRLPILWAWPGWVGHCGCGLGWAWSHLAPPPGGYLSTCPGRAFSSLRRRSAGISSRL